MGDLMNTGMRIRRFRISCGLTQKALGVAVGFPQENADIRIAQYESGTRTPKHELLCRMAQALDITPSALAVPRIRNAEELPDGTLWMMSTALYAMRPTGTADNETIRHTGQAAKGGLPLLCLKGGRCEEIQHYLCRPAVAV